MRGRPWQDISAEPTLSVDDTLLPTNERLRKFSNFVRNFDS
jgi:hypothetical protein